MPDVLPTTESAVSFLAQESDRVKGLIGSAHHLPALVLQEDYDVAALLANRLGHEVKALQDHRLAMTRPLDTTKRMIMDLFTPLVDSLSKAEGQVKARCLAWTRQQEDRARQEREAREAEAAAERAILEGAAERAAARGDEGTFEYLAQTVADVQVEPVAPAYIRAPGTSTMERWHAEVTDLEALIRAVAARAVSPEALLPNMVYLNGRARTDKQGLALPGVRAVSTRTMGVSRT